MDRALVEEITRQVLKELEAGGGDTTSAPAPAGPKGLVVCVGNCAAGIEEAASAVRSAAAQIGGLTVVYAEDAKKGPAAEAFCARLGGNVSVHKEGCRCGEISRTAKVVALPLLSLPFAARLAAGLTDDAAVRVVYRALAAGIPVVAAKDGVFLGTDAGAAPLRALGEAHLAALASMGIRVVATTGLEEAIRAAAAGAPAAMSAPPVRPAANRTGPPARSATLPLREAYEQATAFAAQRLADDPECVPCLAKVSSAFEECVRSGVCRIGITHEDEAHAFDGGGKIAGLIDHTLLKPDAKPSDIEKLCAEARKYKFASVCINPQYVSQCARLLAGSGVKVCTVVGFPLGATTASAKASETRDAVADGADEIDMVINIGALKAGEFRKVEEDIAGIVRSARGRTVKVILETHLLTEAEKVAGCELSKRAGAHFVKTSTGFTGGGATVEDIALMRKVVGPLLGVKASGGVRDRAGAEAMVKAGATRIGASSSIAIVEGKKAESKGY